MTPQLPPRNMLALAQQMKLPKCAEQFGPMLHDIDSPDTNASDDDVWSALRVCPDEQYFPPECEWISPDPS